MQTASPQCSLKQRTMPGSQMTITGLLLLCCLVIPIVFRCKWLRPCGEAIILRVSVSLARPVCANASAFSASPASKRNGHCRAPYHHQSLSVTAPQLSTSQPCHVHPVTGSTPGPSYLSTGPAFCRGCSDYLFFLHHFVYRNCDNPDHNKDAQPSALVKSRQPIKQANQPMPQIECFTVIALTRLSSSVFTW